MAVHPQSMVGMALFGPMADVIPLQWIMVGSGVLLILIAVPMKLSKTMRSS